MKTKAQLFNGQILLAKVHDGKTSAKYAEKRTIFLQGDPADSIFYIGKGRIKLTVVSKRGREAVTAILEAGDFFGEGCLAGQSRRMGTATAMDESYLARLDKGATLAVLHENPAFSELFLTHLLSRHIRMEEDIVDHLFNSSEKRLARVLLLLANFGKDSKPETEIPKLSQETLAEMVGTTRSRVSYFMNKFRKLGYIKYNGALEIRSSLLNFVLHD
jgi:CRP/FNR family cyclic AMP-dependent transcriptional regulator